MAENQHAQFIHARGTLKRTYEKLKKDKKLRIVYFGGSITVGFGSTDVEEKSWRALSGKWFREMFPQAEIELIRSAVGESGTYLGVYRLDRDIISLRPDLLFIEYAFNDSAHQADEKQAGLQYETIVRALKEKCPDCDIVTLITDGRNTIQDEALYPAAQGHERISVYYGIPTLWVSRALGAQLGEITEEKWKKYFLDTVHPTDAGYAAYWECLKEYLHHSLLDTDYSEETDTPSALPPIFSEHLLDGDRKWYSCSREWLKNAPGFAYSDECFLNIPKTPHIGCVYTNQPDAEFIFDCDGTEIAVLSNFANWKLRSAQVLLSLDGQEYRRIPCSSHNPLMLAQDLKPGKHTIRLRPLFEGNAPDTMKIAAVITRDASRQPYRK